MQLFMQKFKDISTKSDIVNFIVFKRKLYQRLHVLTTICVATIFVIFLCFCFNKKETIFTAIRKVSTTMGDVFNQLFDVKINKIRIHLDKNSLLDDLEIENIMKQLNTKKHNRKNTQKTIEKITKNNSLIENIYVRRNISNNELAIFIKEKKIIAIFNEDGCLQNSHENNKKIISIDNKILPYHSLKDCKKIIKICGKINTVNIKKFYQILNKNLQIDDISYIKFYSSGRFDLILKNKLVVKFPRQNWDTSLKRFNKLDAEYTLSKDIQSIKYIDLRVGDRAIIG